MTGGRATALTALVAGGDLENTVFREMVDALPVAVYTTDAEGRLAYFNAAAVKLSGRTPELGTDRWCVTWKLFLPDGTPLPHDQCPMAVALRGAEVPTGIECIAERPDGTRFWFTPCPAVIRDGEGRILGGINLLIDITDRKNAAIEANEQCRTIVETTPECVKIVAPDGTLLFMNAPGLAMIGASSPEAVIGRNVYDIIAPEDRNRFRAFNERICRGEKAFLQFDIVGLTGARRHMVTHGAPLRHADGSTVHLAITHDVTIRKRAEREALLLSAIVDSSDDAIISKDLNGVITSWNKSAERMFGHTAAEAIGQSVATLLIPPDRLGEEPSILARLRSGERGEHFETVRRRKDGALLDISLTVSPVRNTQGEIVGASKIARDISESRRIQAALLASEGRFRQLADTMPQIVWTAHPDGYVDYYNERWYEYTGFSRNTFGDSSWEAILHSEDLPKTREIYYAAIHSGQPYDIEYRLMDRKENRWRWFVGRAVPVRDAKGKIVKWFGTCTDIDEQKRVQDELRRANEDLEQFAFSASHDLQEPLRSVQIYSELLATRHGDSVNEEGQKFLTFVRKGATRMELLVRDLLIYTQVTKIEAPGGATADANEALASALDSLAGVISETGAEINADPLPSLSVQGTHLEQIFQNLIGNAIKYRNPGAPPIVHVTAERFDGHWILAVSDNGIGIAPAYKETIFGLFKRLHSSDEYSGTGIGLAICQRIVDRYNGRIWVESEPGRGSTFRFKLPA
jgi:PAS domain S-box-containing protein